MTREEKAQRRAQMQAYKAEGHSVKETAEAFGVSKGYATQVCKGIAPQTQRRPKHYRNQYANEDGSRILETVSRYSDTFEYAGNYTGTDGTVDLRCKACGTVVTKSWVTVRHPKCRGVCPECQRREAEKKAEEKTIQKEAAHKAAEMARWLRALDKAKQEEFGVCKECGSLFQKTTKKSAYCSPECRVKAENNHRDRRLKGKVISKDITLMKVFNKDKGRCYLCGEECDWNDYEQRGKNIIAGDRYPSIDHVIPLAHGGLHEWGNVRLAHRLCNTMKRDIPLSEKKCL